MFVLSYVLPPEGGAAYGKARVCDPMNTTAQVAGAIAGVLLAQRRTDRPLFGREADAFGMRVASAQTGEFTHGLTGLAFRIDPEDRAPNACPCCGRLVKWTDHVFAGSDDAYCDGCFTWGDSSKISCDPKNTAHANPWTTDTKGARYHMHVVIDHDGETGEDDRYTTTDEHEIWDEVDNALIAWPGLTVDQIIDVEITKIDKEN